MKLMVSYNCGIGYGEEMRAETLEPLLARAKEMRLDEEKLRWTIEDDAGEILEASAIHKSILSLLQRENFVDALDVMKG